MRGARRPALGRRAVAGAAEAPAALNRAGRAAGDRHLPRLGPRQGPSAHRRAGRPALAPGRAAHRPARPRRRRGGGDHDAPSRATSSKRTRIELAGQIAAETDGNPFFVGEILRGLSESGALVFDEASASLEHRQLGRDRAARERARGDRAPRGAPRRGVTGGAAARGGDRPRVRPRAARRPSSRWTRRELLDQLETAVAASVLAESSEQVGRFRFVHALINQTLYEGLGATRRARMHQRVAEALEELYGADPASTWGSSRCTGGWPPCPSRGPRRPTTR